MDLIVMMFGTLVSLLTMIQCHVEHMNQAAGSVPQQPPHLDKTGQHGTFHEKAQVHDRE